MLGSASRFKLNAYLINSSVLEEFMKVIKAIITTFILLFALDKLTFPVLAVEKSAYIEIAPVKEVYKMGDQFNANLNVSNIEDLYSFQVTLKFSKDSLSIEGDKLGKSQWTKDKVFEITNIVNNDDGYVTYAITKLGKVNGESPESIVSVPFKVSDNGEKWIKIEELTLVDSKVQLIKFNLDKSIYNLSNISSVNITTNADVSTNLAQNTVTGKDNEKPEDITISTDNKTNNDSSSEIKKSEEIMTNTQSNDNKDSNISPTDEKVVENNDLESIAKLEGNNKDSKDIIETIKNVFSNKTAEKSNETAEKSVEENTTQTVSDDEEIGSDDKRSYTAYYIILGGLAVTAFAYFRFRSKSNRNT
jgi:hypothetical protein